MRFSRLREIMIWIRAMGTDENSVQVLAVAYSKRRITAHLESILQGLDDREKVEGHLKRMGLSP